MNMQLANTEEYVDGALAGHLGEVLIRKKVYECCDSLTLCLDDNVLVLQRGGFWEDSLDVPVITTACDGQLQVFFNDGSHLVKVFDLVASCSLLRCVNLTLEFEPIHKDQSI
ncbi:hypothetical protein cypCar_00021615 [Cyprinus carpio]|nr:hypothetical protein cypCar_00021615 [Cyprinus carpio]